jgi:hypothetical protein
MASPTTTTDDKDKTWTFLLTAGQERKTVTIAANAELYQVAALTLGGVAVQSLQEGFPPDANMGNQTLEISYVSEALSFNRCSMQRHQQQQLHEEHRYNDARKIVDRAVNNDEETRTTTRRET